MSLAGLQGLWGSSGESLAFLWGPSWSLGALPLIDLGGSLGLTPGLEPDGAATGPLQGRYGAATGLQPDGLPKTPRTP